MAQKLKLLWLAFFILNIVVIFCLQSQVPETVATHFDGRGVPNGWMSRSILFIFDMGSAFFTNGLLLVFYFTLHKFPESIINIPNKDYWFSNADRKSEAMIRLKDVLAVTGLFVNLVLLVTHHIVSQENGGWVSFRAPVNTWVGLIFAMTVVFLIIVFNRTRLPADARRDNRK